jgi:hypothetical protein
MKFKSIIKVMSLLSISVYANAEGTNRAPFDTSRSTYLFNSKLITAEMVNTPNILRIKDVTGTGETVQASDFIVAENVNSVTGNGAEDSTPLSPHIIVDKDDRLIYVDVDDCVGCDIYLDINSDSGMSVNPDSTVTVAMPSNLERTDVIGADGGIPSFGVPEGVSIEDITVIVSQPDVTSSENTYDIAGMTLPVWKMYGQTDTYMAFQGDKARYEDFFKLDVNRGPSESGGVAGEYTGDYRFFFKSNSSGTVENTTNLDYVVSLYNADDFASINSGAIPVAVFTENERVTLPESTGNGDYLAKFTIFSRSSDGTITPHEKNRVEIARYPYRSPENSAFHEGDVSSGLDFLITKELRLGYINGYGVLPSLQLVKVDALKYDIAEDIRLSKVRDTILAGGDYSLIGLDIEQDHFNEISAGTYGLTFDIGTGIAGVHNLEAYIVGPHKPLDKTSPVTSRSLGQLTYSPQADIDTRLSIDITSDITDAGMYYIVLKNMAFAERAPVYYDAEFIHTPISLAGTCTAGSTEEDEFYDFIINSNGANYTDPSIDELFANNDLDLWYEYNNFGDGDVPNFPCRFTDSFVSSIDFAGNNFTHADFFENLTKVGTVYLYDIGSNMDLSGLNNIKEAVKISFEDNDIQLTAPTMTALTKYKKLVIESNSKITSLTGFDNVTEIAGIGNTFQASTYIVNNNSLINIMGFNSVAGYVDGSIYVGDNDNLKTINMFNNAQQFSEMFIATNPKLTSLTLAGNAETLFSLVVKDSPLLDDISITSSNTDRATLTFSNLGITNVNFLLGVNMDLLNITANGSLTDFSGISSSDMAYLYLSNLNAARELLDRDTLLCQGLKSGATRLEVDGTYINHLDVVPAPADYLCKPE